MIHELAPLQAHLSLDTQPPFRLTSHWTRLLLDDVMNRGHTTGVCALRLRECGCERVIVLVLALAESSLQSSRHAQRTGS